MRYAATIEVEYDEDGPGPPALIAENTYDNRGKRVRSVIGAQLIPEAVEAWVIERCKASAESWQNPLPF